ncbi:type IV pili methyl-accepting chemotaxis transducer N-terminal domain-containing protein [Pseudoalteromonas denitrificans]|uniref:Type IV pili methyl-accepting chemotaxis transducer N-term n=1 Tax=Pseudoalteromonas denitrificans DSM 6059 TaxID=1123010 RepID=A0A1I1TQQ8_9GAMM|nr:type IV pili methyl-accepting chemotaxis transducer N-terminal domain-containing protein [Pseudoalteromonas denitrificans]SFD59568.1 Type IV pili methyl-accepting chemotaxis transducer N-term [Pseudoalteromonas denitrificans DSM 6059]
MNKLTLLLLIFFFTFPSQAKVLSLAQTINQAGLQRMLSQRIAKNYILIASQITPEKATIELDKSIATFEENLHNLAESITDDKSKKALKVLKLRWFDFRIFVLSEPDRKHTIKIVDFSADILRTANKLVLSLERFSNKPSAKLINVSGRQRMLSQKIALYYLASYSGFKEDYYLEQLIKTANEFTLGLDILMLAKGNTTQINEELTNVHEQWSFYKSRFESNKKARYVPRVIQVITETILKDMNDLTSLYEAILK